MESLTTLYDLFLSGCKTSSNNCAVEYYSLKKEKKTLSYYQLLSTSNIVKNKLTNIINKLNGHNICLYFHQNLYHCSFILGIMSVSSFYSYIHPNTHEDEMLRILNENYTSIVITDFHFIKKLQIVINKMKKQIEINLISFTEDKTEVFYIVKILNCNEKYNKYQSVAYCLRTSGSLGKPKKVYSTHSSIVSNLLDLKKVFGCTSKDKIAGVSSLSFDLSVIEMFLSFACGATYVVLSNTCLMSTSLSSELLIKVSKVTIIQCTPSFLKRYSINVLQEDIFSQNSSLRILAMGGEAFPQHKTLMKWFKNIITNSKFHLQIFNLFGLTEVSCWATYNCITLKNLNLLREEPVPIGIPFSNTYLEVSNKQGCLALIYTQNEKVKIILSQNVVINSSVKLKGLLRVGSEIRTNYIEPILEISNSLDSIFNLPGVKMVETGDLVSIEINISDKCMCSTFDRLTEVHVEKENLNILFLGRLDNQVKRNGKRVNTCFIESQILQSNYVDSAFVTLIDRNVLVAFCVASKPFVEISSNVLSERVNNVLHSKLSKVFIPTEILFTDSLPLTVNGKVCKNTLVKNYENIKIKNTNDSICLIPFKNLNTLLSTFWKEVLNKNSDYKFGEDKFLYHGGDSISAVRILNLLNDHIPNFSIKVPNFLDLLFTKSFSSIIDELNLVFLETKQHLNDCLKRKHYENNIYQSPKIKKDRFLTTILNHDAEKIYSKGLEVFYKTLHLKADFKYSLQTDFMFDTNKCVDASPLIVCNKGNTDIFIG